MNDPFQMQRELRYGAPVCDEILTGRYFTIGYSWYFRQPKWVLEIINPNARFEWEIEDRLDNFRADIRIPRRFRAGLKAYKKSGYDRGHLVGSANQDELRIQNSETFLLSNMSPQKPDFNRRIWRDLELAIRKLNAKDNILETYVLTAPQKITKLAYYDELTGLPNRRLFSDRLSEEITVQKGCSERAVVLFLDIDHFKEINETLGHSVGDKLLQAISKRLSMVLRESDLLARLGGDEFAILMIHESGGIEAVDVAELIIELFKAPFIIDDLKVPTSTSIGITFCEPKHTSEDIIAQTDVALYEAKNSGRNNFVFYESEMSNKVKEDVSIFSELRQAIQRQEFSTYYQPQIDAKSGEVVGLEALIRWFPQSEHAKKYASPARFIPIAETRNLIRDISIWQVHQLIEDFRDLRAAGFKGRVSINVSGELLNHIENMVELVEVIEHSDLSYRELEFEITETAYSKLTEAENAILIALQVQGLELAIDDFGTGYSSLATLRQFRSNYLKIDKQFIDEVHCNDDDHAIVSATISMAHGLGKKVIAEGVETKEQLEALCGLKCDLIQGYYYAKPMPLKQACEFI